MRHADHEYIPPGDERYRGFRVESLWLALAVDPADDQEGIIATPLGPAIASDERRLADLRPFIAAFATAQGVAVRIVRFELAEQVDLVRPTATYIPRA